jgi:1,4-dihydroxy-2-naphthoyl-CoA hydrolase
MGEPGSYRWIVVGVSTAVNALAGPPRRIPHPIWTPSLREQASAGKAGRRQAYARGQGDSMAIWFCDFSVEDARQRAAGCMIGAVGIELTERGDDYLKGSMPVDARTRQTVGLLHGGASCVLAETLGSWATKMVLDPSKFHGVGLEINANHLRGVAEGHVHGIARPLHLGRTTHVWDIRISNDEGKLVCVARLTMAVLERAGQQGAST